MTFEVRRHERRKAFTKNRQIMFGAVQFGALEGNGKSSNEPGLM